MTSFEAVPAVFGRRVHLKGGHRGICFSSVRVNPDLARDSMDHCLLPSSSATFSPSFLFRGSSGAWVL